MQEKVVTPRNEVSACAIAPFCTRSIPPLYHVLAAGFVAWCVWMALARPDAYESAMQEDRAIEWASVLFFAAAGVIGLARAIRQRRAFDGLVALFCLFFAGEEMSWGQRLLGLTPPAYFLEHNTQQEMNLHNFAALLGSPKGPFMLILFGYSVVLPLVALTQRGRALLSRIGATPPPAATIPWFAGAALLLFWYPFKFTGEWTELLAGSAFFVAVGGGVSAPALLASAGAVAAAALLLTTWSSRGGDDPARIACATAEVNALADGLRRESTNGDLAESGSLHKRVWTLAAEDYVDAGVLRRSLSSVSCRDRAGDARRRFAVDPWGTAYWVRVAGDDATSVLTVYSFGPNRRRDTDANGVASGDDIVARARVSSR